jgi:hypothetical protein
LCLCLTGPPKALDEDETEFLDSLEMVSMWYVGASCSFRATLIVGYVALLTCIKDSMLKQPGAILLFCLCCLKIMLCILHRNVSKEVQLNGLMCIHDT